MSRPRVSVVMPFAGDTPSARAAVQTLLSLETEPGDQLILADNSPLAAAPNGAVSPRVTLVRAGGEASPAYARNIGAARATGEWILFLDADCHAPADLLEKYFADPIREDVGALAGGVIPAPDRSTVAARYGAARSFLAQEVHLAHPYRPRAVAANLLVRRSAFEQVGGFYEGVRAAEDTDFSWRLQGAGWRLEPRMRARVEHRYRASIRELRRQWRGYAAGRAWLARRYAGFEPEPAARRAFRRGRKGGPRALLERRAGGPDGAGSGRVERGRHLALDVVLSADELAGFALSNRPSGRPRATAEVVLVAERFPALGDPLVEFARALEGTRAEAAARPEVVDLSLTRSLQIDYREDDGLATRLVSLARLAVRHPLRCVLDVIQRRPGDPSLIALAPGALRLARDPRARVHPLGAEQTRATAQRLARLAGRPLARR